MSSTHFIPHHLFVSAASQPARAKRKPVRDLLEGAPFVDEATTVSFEFFEDEKDPSPFTRPLRVCTEAS